MTDGFKWQCGGNCRIFSYYYRCREQSDMIARMIHRHCTNSCVAHLQLQLAIICSHFEWPLAFLFVVWALCTMQTFWQFDCAVRRSLCGPVIDIWSFTAEQRKCSVIPWSVLRCKSVTTATINTYNASASRSVVHVPGALLPLVMFEVLQPARAQVFDILKFSCLIIIVEPLSQGCVLHVATSPV